MSRLQSASDLLARVANVVGDDLLAAEAAFAAEVHSDNEYVADILAHSDRFRGKRMRPILLLLSASACGKVEKAHHVLAAVVEMIHTATLVHDDVLDDADVRRHVATVHTRWNTETSVLFGDYLFTHAFHLAASLENARACRIIGRATNRVCEGELSQIRQRGNFHLTEAEYMHIIDGKTAELCAVSCLLGALYAGADDSIVEALEAYGRKLGLAFQIADDVLDISGSEGDAGKSLGSDLELQKLTLPIIRLLASRTESERTELIRLLESPAAADHERIAELCRREGTIDEALKEADRLSAEACAHLQVLPSSPARQVLEELAELAVDRSC